MNKTEQPEHPARKSRTGLIADLCTPLLLLVLCGAITAVAAIKPYEKLQTYLNIAFMDNFKNSDPQAGLLIKNNQINTEHQGQTYTEGEILVPAFGEQYATLSCDSISLNVPVYWGTTAALLERGACQATSSVVLGNPGNVVIDAHVNTFLHTWIRCLSGIRWCCIPSTADLPMRFPKPSPFKRRTSGMWSPQRMTG